MREPKIMRHPGLQPLWDSLQREWQQQQFAAVALLLVSIAGIVYGALNNGTLLLFLCSLAGCIGLFWLFRLTSQKPVGELYGLLLDEPENFAWVYALVTERLPFGLSFSASAVVYFYFADGEELSVSLPSSKVKLVIKTLRRVLPNAEFGYTEERELKYRGEVTTRKYSWWKESDF